MTNQSLPGRRVKETGSLPGGVSAFQVWAFERERPDARRIAPVRSWQHRDDAAANHNVFPALDFLFFERVRHRQRQIVRAVATLEPAPPALFCD